MSDFFDYNISINYPETIRQSRRIEQIANQCAELNTRVKNEVNHIKQSWRGKSSDALQEKLLELQEYNRQLENDLNVVAQRMRNIANEIKEADEASCVRIREI
ncbi:MAG: WXG100 family type VII secretion target [Tyzzerella sp.]|nr:WXG100 family type VII secretion target [Tyzzerella sp.]